MVDLSLGRLALKCSTNEEMDHEVHGTFHIQSEKLKWKLCMA